MRHTLKFKVGARVRVIADRFAHDPAAPASHELEIGEVYTITETQKESREGDWPCNYQEYRLGRMWVAEDEIEPAD